MWENIILSTSNSIARFEKEINRLASYNIRWSIYTEEPDIYFDIEDILTVYYSTGESKILEENVIPVKKYIIKIEQIREGAVIATYPITEGKGYVLHSEDGQNLLQVRKDGIPYQDIWAELETDNTWQDKIDLAKEMLKYEIETALTEMHYYVDEFAGKRLIDIISNPETFSLASDYLTLHLIYTDLANGGFNELFQNKADYYWKRYKQELNNCFKRLNIDYNQTGNPIYRVKIEGYVSR
ncbi:MAG TPA: hypothetical protein PK143_06015 [Candidatus Syntrophosphaera thermopropionivorans]|nr:hypothetical protein [Candidatus Syntrophosphaera thermopropionivorans]